MRGGEETAAAAAAAAMAPACRGAVREMGGEGNEFDFGARGARIRRGGRGSIALPAVGGDGGARVSVSGCPRGGPNRIQNRSG